MSRTPGQRMVLPTMAVMIVVLGVAVISLWMLRGGGGEARLRDDPDLVALALAFGAQVDDDDETSLAVAADEAAAGRGRNTIDIARAAVVRRPEQPEPWLVLVAASARWPTWGGATDEERLRILAVLQAAAPDHPVLPGARAWQALSQGAPDAALAALDPVEHAEPWALAARLRALRDLGRDPLAAARALHAAVPGDVEGCRELARAELDRGDFFAVDQVVATCEGTGVEDPILDRFMATVLDAAGEPEEACRLYLEAGAVLHAVVIHQQDGRCPAAPARTAAELLAETTAEARLHGTWGAVLAGDADTALAGARLLDDLPQAEHPPFRLARAAARLVAGQPDAAISAIDGMVSAPARVLRGRALAAKGQGEQALAELQAATTDQPWALAAWRTRLAMTARIDPDQLPAVTAELAQADPVALALARLEVDRLQPWAAIAPDAWPDAWPDDSTEQLRSRLSALVGTFPEDSVAARWAHAEQALAEGDAHRARAAALALVDARPDLPGVRAWRYALELELRARDARAEGLPTDLDRVTGAD